LSNMVFHNSQDEYYRFPFGAVEYGSRINLKLAVGSKSPGNSANLILLREGHNEVKVPMGIETERGEGLIYSADITAPPESGLLWYFFEVIIEGEKCYYGNNEGNFGGEGSLYRAVPPYYQITVYDKGASTPGWFKKAVMYQVFVDRFYNGIEGGRVLGTKKNSFLYADWEDTPMYIRDSETGAIKRWDFFGGNLPGLIQKLEYLKELGISVIYLNPVFEAPSNHKYDTADYMKIDPMFGDNEIFRELCVKAGRLGISIILDGVFSHTGSDSIYFNKYGNYPGTGAYQSESSPYYSWYRFKGSRDSYECWWGVDSLPNVNEMDPSYIDFIITGRESVIKHWMGQGAKGWRLDVADELPDEFISMIRKTMKSIDPDSVLIGEVWEDASNKISYGSRRRYLMGEELDSVMNYPFRDTMLDFFLHNKDAKHTARVLMRIYENYPLHNFYSNMNLIGTHDVPRVLTILGEAPSEEGMSLSEKEKYRLPEQKRRTGIARLKLLSLIQMTFPGVPSVYYGDEAGMEGYRDPLNRGTYPWGKEEKELQNWYRKIIGIRNRYDVLSTGKLILLPLEGDVFGYIRVISNGMDVFGNTANDNLAVILVNRNKDLERRVTIDISRYCSGVLYNLVRGNIPVETAEGILNLVLKPLEGMILIKNHEE
jgi:cyclomaltodextrinase